MSGEQLVKLVGTLLGDYAHGRELDVFIVDTDAEVFVFQKGGPHLALVVKAANIEVNGGVS